jgi:hypothetical protein
MKMLMLFPRVPVGTATSPVPLCARFREQRLLGPHGQRTPGVATPRACATMAHSVGWAFFEVEGGGYAPCG